MLVEITCPSCEKFSLLPEEKIPAGKLKTTCHACRKQFSLDKLAKLNCKFHKVRNKQIPTVFPEEGWVVDHPISQGISYDLKGVGKLICSGYITPVTKVRPPSMNQMIEARRVFQLKKYFEEYKRSKTSWTVIHGYS